MSQQITKVRSSSGSTKGLFSPENNRSFAPYKIRENARIYSTALAVRLACDPTEDSNVLRASIGLTNILKSAYDQDRSDQPISNDQAAYVTGLSSQTLKKALDDPNALAEIVSTGKAYDWASDTVEVTKYALKPLVGDYEFTTPAPIYALSPNHPRWKADKDAYGTNGWRLALACYGTFGTKRAATLNLDQVKQWTGWSEDTIKRVMVKVIGTFIIRIRRGHYEFQPHFLMTQNSEVLPEVPEWMHKNAKRLADKRGSRSEGGSPAKSTDAGNTLNTPSGEVIDLDARKKADAEALRHRNDFLAVHEYERWASKGPA